MSLPPLPEDGLRLLRRGGVIAAGAGLIGLGVIMLVVPGPGLVTIAAGLGVLSTEFEDLARMRRALVERWQRLRGARPAQP
ncbi:MAG: hypothetical protein CL910_01315 [Deltaproteobacteria bacterium]|nr:hypothetical protein [Deltaproteobacteria bacterium]